jgi:hypothetical protein
MGELLGVSASLSPVLAEQPQSSSTAMSARNSAQWQSGARGHECLRRVGVGYGVVGVYGARSGEDQMRLLVMFTE